MKKLFTKIEYYCIINKERYKGDNMIALSIGKSTYDTTVPVDVYPVENSKNLIKEKLESSGGSGSNVAYLLAKWNNETYFAGVVGYDDFGSFIKKDLESVSVHTNFMEVNYERKTTTTFIIANKKTTSRTQLMIEPEIYHLKKYDYDIVPTVIYSDGYEYSATMAAINKFPEAITVLGAGLNYADPKEVVSIAKEVKYVVFSLEFACQVTKMRVDVTNPTHLLNLYKELREKFPKNEIIVTLQNKGAMFSINNEVKVMQTIPVQEVDRSGAGDIFDGALIYGLGKGYNLEICIRLANIAAALSTTKYGAKDSIPLLSDVIQYYENKFGPLNVTPPEKTESSEMPNAQEASPNTVGAPNDLPMQKPNLASQVPNQNQMPVQNENPTSNQG